jgi:hypothetical protein
MTNVEALMSVEAGRVPEGVRVFVERDEDSGRGRVWGVLALLLGGITCFVAATGTQTRDTPYEVGLMAVFTAFALIMATPTTDEQMSARRRRVLVVGKDGFITRDAYGLRNWLFDEIVSIALCTFDGVPHLMLEDRFGKEHLLDHANFENAEALLEILREGIARRAIAIV